MFICCVDIFVLACWDLRFYRIHLNNKDTNSNLRLGFRENMAFIIGLSEHFLIKSSRKWAEFVPNKKLNIKYVYYK